VTVKKVENSKFTNMNVTIFKLHQTELIANFWYNVNEPDTGVERSV